MQIQQVDQAFLIIKPLFKNKLNTKSKYLGKQIIQSYYFELIKINMHYTGNSIPSAVAHVKLQN